MAKTNVADLQCGMVLAEDVVDHNGRLLIPAQTSLTERHIRGLKMWGVRRVGIVSPEGEPAEAVPEISPEQRAAAERYVAYVFQQNAEQLDHPLVHTLREKAMNRFLHLPIEQQRRLDESVTAQEPPLPQGEEPMLDPSRLMPKIIAQRAHTVASLPAVYTRLMEVINHPHSSSDDIASVIRADQGLTARLLRIVNSSFYGFPHRIDTITRAITIIGTTQLCEMALATTVVRLFRLIPSDIVSQRSFWTHCVACGIVARGLGALRRDANLERMFIAGLLHDIGRAVMLVYYPALCRTAIREAYGKRIPLNRAEQELFGFSHADVGQALLEEWGLPEFYASVIARHHRPMAITRHAFEVALVHVADFTVHTMNMGATGDPSAPILHTPSWESLGLNVDVVPELTEEAARQVDEMVAILSQDEER